MANSDRLIATLDRINNLGYPEYRQNCWCACFGANAIQEYGYEVSQINGGERTKVYDAAGVEIGNAPDVAREILELTHGEAGALFAASNSKAQVADIVHAIIEGSVSQEDWDKVARFDLEVDEVLERLQLVNA
jgi:hypothetical protein